MFMWQSTSAQTRCPTTRKMYTQIYEYPACLRLKAGLRVEFNERRNCYLTSQQQLHISIGIGYKSPYCDGSHVCYSHQAIIYHWLPICLGLGGRVWVNQYTVYVAQFTVNNALNCMAKFHLIVKSCESTAGLALPTYPFQVSVDDCITLSFINHFLRFTRRHSLYSRYPLLFPTMCIEPTKAPGSVTGDGKSLTMPAGVISHSLRLLRWIACVYVDVCVCVCV